MYIEGKSTQTILKNHYLTKNLLDHIFFTPVEHIFPSTIQKDNRSSKTRMQLISSILSFDESWKFRIHITQIVLIALAIILSIGRVTIRNPPATRANTVAITMVRIISNPTCKPCKSREHTPT